MTVLLILGDLQEQRHHPLKIEVTFKDRHKNDAPGWVGDSCKSNPASVTVQTRSSSADA
jgi:hypothetical protein